MATNGDLSGVILNPDNKKRISASKRWCFTLNNYTEEEYGDILTTIKEKCEIYIIGKELGENNKIPHLQGYIEFKTNRRPIETFKIKKIHWEKAKGNRNDNFKYCSKQGDYVANFKNDDKTFEPLIIINDLKGWQAKMNNIIIEEIKNRDFRKIHWIYDPLGGKGKTSLIKYLDTKFTCVISTVSNKSDVATLIRGRFYDEKDKPIEDINKGWLMLFNFQKDYDYSKLNYDTLESIKDGLITATKYRGKTLNFNSPVVVIMANERPLNLINKRITVYEFNEIDELIEL